MFIAATPIVNLNREHNRIDCASDVASIGQVYIPIEKKAYHIDFHLLDNWRNEGKEVPFIF